MKVLSTKTKGIILVALMLLFQIKASGQAAQTIKGRLTDSQSKYPLIGATVVLVGSNPLKGTATDNQGDFKLSDVPLGRHILRISYLGYEERVIPNVLVTAGKEVVINVELDEKIIMGEEVVVTTHRDKSASGNELSTVSARSFDIEETSRYAGSRNDPARMASNFAGVSGANDSRNDIIIRGNSPSGLLWRLNGINIPNPSHFGALASTGGPVSILNNNTLDKSDFMTGAFPAQYGNALAGVFDLQMRSGNNEKREYLGQVGFNGFELGAEGPFTKKSKASYVFNYRYSTLGVFKALGLNFGTGAAVPQYQDLSFKIDAPTKHLGTFSVFGLGGISNIDLLGSKVDTTSHNLYGTENQDFYLKYRTGIIGATNVYYFNSSTYSKISVAASQIGEGALIDSLSATDRIPVRETESNYIQNKYSLSFLLSKKFNARHNVTGGVIGDLYGFNLKNDQLIKDVGFREVLNSNGNSVLLQAYLQWQYRINDRLTLNPGLNFLHFFLNNSAAIEPRLGIRYHLKNNQSFNFGYGYHSQMQPLQTYFTQTRISNDAYILTNKNMNFTRSQHFVLGYDNLIARNLKLRLETYYQYITGAPVEQRPSSFSMLNSGADFVVPQNDSLVNKGTGRNYGLEITLEKFYADGFYFLVTTSLFDTKYKGSDHVLRNTSFNGKYVVNTLAGKEFKIGKKSNTFNIDWKMTVAGGKYRTPLDLDKSKVEGDEVYQEDKAYSYKLKDYFRSDIKLSFRINRKKITQEFSLDVQNFTNAKNVFTQRYNPRTNSLTTEYQLGIFPIPQFRLLF